MATGSQISGPQSYAFMPTGGTQVFTIAAVSVTTTLTQFNTVIAPAPEAGFIVTGAAGAVNALFVTFDAPAISASSAMPIPTLATLGSNKNIPLTVLRTGVRPRAVIQMMCPGTCTVYVTPGEGSA